MSNQEEPSVLDHSGHYMLNIQLRFSFIVSYNIKHFKKVLTLKLETIPYLDFWSRLQIANIYAD